MHVYIAGSSGAQKRLREERDKLPPGITCTSSWLDLDFDYLQYPVEPEVAREDAARDFNDVLSSDLLILDTLDETTHGGREVELGYAHGSDLAIIIVGPVRNIFHELFTRVDSWDRVHALIRGGRNG